VTLRGQCRLGAGRQAPAARAGSFGNDFSKPWYFMKLASLISEENVLINELSGSKTQALRQMLDRMVTDDSPVSRGKIFDELIARENQLSSYIGNGVATPHAKIDGLMDTVIALATSQEGIDAEMLTGENIHLLFLILTPGEKNTLMLQTLAAVARLCHSKDSREALSRIKSPSRVVKLIEETGIEVKMSICASDVMEKEFTTLSPQMNLRQALEVMVSAPCDGLAVVDESGKVEGELSSVELIRLGLPGYVDMLSDDTFLANFEPFEQFSDQQQKTTVDQIMTREIITVPPDCPIVKVGHLLVQMQKSRAYVVGDQKLAGIVFRKDFLTKVLQ
jgi:PTS system nitrogen regulatory IIA component